MSRNMIETNKKFFSNILSTLNSEISQMVSSSKRYIFTNEEEKNWLKNANIKYKLRIFRDSYILLMCLLNSDYICLINVNGTANKLPPALSEIPVNAGIATILGAEGYLTPPITYEQQLKIYDEIMYDTSEKDGVYRGHQWSDIESFFPNISCYSIKLNNDVDIRENKNLFYQISCQILFELNLDNNPNMADLSDAWEKIFYELSVNKLNYKNILMSYISLTWDISYLYLYQCLEDQFVCEAVRSLHKRLDVDLSEQELSEILYEEISWQPRDIEAIKKIIDKYSFSEGIKIIEKISNGESVPKFIYRVRNSIVHETRDAYIPLEEVSKWKELLRGILYLLMNIAT